MAFFEWKDSFSVKVPEIDQQHKRLIDLINRLHETLRTGGDPSAAQRVLDDLVVYTRHHFSSEEKLLEQCNYPDLAEHRRKHQAMEARVQQFIKDGATATASGQIQLMGFLKHWLQKHILETDMRYSSHLAACLRL